MVYYCTIPMATSPGKSTYTNSQNDVLCQKCISSYHFISSVVHSSYHLCYIYSYVASID